MLHRNTRRTVNHGTCWLPELHRAAEAAWPPSNPCGLQHKSEICNMSCMLHSTTPDNTHRTSNVNARSHLAVAGASTMQCSTLHSRS